MVDQLDVSPVAAGDSEAAGAPAGRLRRWLADAVALAVLLAAFFAVNDVPGWISAPYWLDESWVALSTRVPLADLPHITSSTPIGWSLLLRVIPDPDALRLLPLAFALIALVAAYALGRLLPWRTRAESVLAGYACAAMVLLLPAEQARHDLKQYTADAAVAMVYLALTAWLERGWSQRRLVVVAAVAPVALLLSQVTLIVAVAAFASLMVTAAIRRQWHRLVECVIAGAAAGGALGILYLVFVEPNRNGALTAFWTDYYPSFSGLPGFLHARVRALIPVLGFPRLAIAVPVAVAGLVVLAVQRRIATLGVLVVIPLCLVVLGISRMYPLLDERTSYFLLVAAAALGGVALAGCATALARLLPRTAARIWRPVVAGVLALAALGLFALHNREWYRLSVADPRVPEVSPIAISDVRTQTRWIDEHRASGDVVVISTMARFGYVYYHNNRPMTWKPWGNTIGWDPVTPREPHVVLVQGTSSQAIEDALHQAVALARHNGPDARILLLRTWPIDEVDAWRAALQPYTLTYPYSGVEPVTIIANP